MQLEVFTVESTHFFSKVQLCETNPLVSLLPSLATTCIKVGRQLPRGGYYLGELGEALRFYGSGTEKFLVRKLQK